MERIIYERDDLVLWQEKYLREIAKARETELQREIMYMDETWLNEGHRLQKEWGRQTENFDMAAQKPKLEKENASLLPMQ